MGICASCLGRGGRDSHDSESSRLLDDDLYQSGYGYGAVGSAHRQGPDPESLKREREALEAICQRTSDSVIDIWALQSPHPPRPAPSSIHTTTASSSRAASHQTATSSTTEEPQSPAQEQKTESQADSIRRAASPAPGEFGKLRYAPLPPTNDVNLSNVPKQWGEVVMTARRGKKTRLGINTENGKDESKDIFAVLVID
ncbi:hypothetical protein BDBG_02177 [Blastomyces gilchristii SLH14081]|uniref:Uncharacterized protein n=1 Tax=Blastomyces gilchristii (strain SLH14081) TaxID=559298 RepID=A0A179UH64_BLAGS|nr:uncharacterized protein BDBG_02177 [Blastomyces gilchristii SLH14081]EQL33655.1 hypothetical protein BDFG_04395 [Blastomyces dermatitidis ATCC 26199]OAT05852.1 hypothetical protein BDBG_02177 [Blastomyces gilchristii SLH14081]